MATESSKNHEQDSKTVAPTDLLEQHTPLDPNSLNLRDPTSETLVATESSKKLEQDSKTVAPTDLRTANELWGNLITSWVDWITITVPELEAADLVAQTADPEPGYGRPGFRRSEKRLCMGGEVWRRWEPTQPSKDWGLAYESWEASGGGAEGIADHCRGFEHGRPSRIDIAFDFNVAPDFTATDCFRTIAERVEFLGLQEGEARQGKVSTHYIGGRNSEKRIRIYRKDIEDELWKDTFGPCLRVELQVRGDTAVALWQELKRDDDRGRAVAAGVIAAMTGVQVQPELAELPDLAPLENADLMQSYLTFMKQHGARLHTFREAGFNLEHDAKMVSDATSTRTKYRWAKKVKEADIDPEVLSSILGRVLAY